MPEGHSIHWCIFQWLTLPWGHHAVVDKAEQDCHQHHPPFTSIFSRAVIGFGVILGIIHSRWRALNVHFWVAGCLQWCITPTANQLHDRDMPNIVGIPMRFACRGVCIMRYCGPMRYAMQFPAHRLGGQMELCVMRGYALSEACVMRGSTVHTTLVTFSHLVVSDRMCRNDYFSLLGGGND